MHIAFKRLFRIRVRHDWYPDAETRVGDFEVVPTPSTAALLAELALRTRVHPDGLTVFGEVEPGTTPPVLMRPFGADSLRFAFELRSRNPLLLNVTELPPFRPARTVFCFDNLREDVASGRTHLGDSVAAARIGAAVKLVTGRAYTHALGAPAVSATVTVRDRFGVTVATVDARSPDSATPREEHQLDLAGLVPGRYEIADDRGGLARIYYDSSLASSRPLGLVEIFSRTDGVTPDATNRVPASYRFLSGDTVTGLGPYDIQFGPLETTWRYIVTKKYANSGVELAQLQVAGPITFTGAVTGDRAVFTSAAAVRLSAASRGLKLQRQPPPRDVTDLPDPDLTTPIGSVPSLPNFVSDMFVYV